MSDFEEDPDYNTTRYCYIGGCGETDKNDYMRPFINI